MDNKAGLTFILLFILFALQGRDISVQKNPVVIFPLISRNIYFCVMGLLMSIPVIPLLNKNYQSNVHGIS